MSEVTISFTPTPDLLERVRSLLGSATGFLDWVDSIDVDADPRYAVVTFSEDHKGGYGEYDHKGGGTITVRYETAAVALVKLATPELQGRVRGPYSSYEKVSYWAQVQLEGNGGIYLSDKSAILVDAVLREVLKSH